MVSCKWKCMECRSTFWTRTDAAQVFGEECPRCGGTDLDLISVGEERATHYDNLEFTPEHEQEATHKEVGYGKG